MAEVADAVEAAGAAAGADVERRAVETPDPSEVGAYYSFPP